MKKLLLAFLLFSAFNANAQILKINEVMPNNGLTSFDSFDEPSDWLEIYNNSSAVIQLSDYYISNSQTNKLKWQLPFNNLQPGNVIMVYCSGKDIILFNEYHANFKLKNQTDTLGIYFKDGSVIDELVYDSLPVDISFGLKPDGVPSSIYFQAPTPNATNNSSVGFNCLLASPMVSKASGFYSSPMQIDVSHIDAGVQLRYSENGDEPKINSPLLPGSMILNTSYAPNRLSEIPTNPGLNAPQGFYSVTRANNRGYVPPAVDVQNINVFSVRAFKSGCIPSEEVKRTFILDDGNLQIPNLPIMSLQTDSFGFFSNDTGIYVYGNQTLGNYSGRGKAWERESELIYFDENRNTIIDQKLISELHGNGSRHSTQKNIRVTAKSILGSNRIEAAIFDKSDVSTFKHLVLRSPGHRPDCMPRDELATYMVENLNMDFPHYSTSIMYLNGEYWGINVLKERLDDDYLSIKYDIEKDQIAILEGQGIADPENLDDTLHYHELMEFVASNSLNIPENMEFLETQMDVDNYLDYMIAEIYIGNADWPNNNVRFWRKRVDYDDFASPGHDGKWRWLYFDIDGGFGGTCEDVSWAINNLERALMDTGFLAKHTQFFRDLTSSTYFRNLYINRTCDKLNTNFLESVTSPKLNEIITDLNPVMMDHVNRFGYPSLSTTLADRLTETPSLNKWTYLVSRFEKFMQKRNTKIFEQMDAQWALGDTFKITIDVNDEVMGYVQFNSIKISSEHEGISAAPYPWQGTYFENLEIPMTAQAFPGYRFKEWLGTSIVKADTSIIISSDTMFTAVFEIDPNYVPPMAVTINELQASNTNTIYDEYFEYDDWIELYNPNPEAVDLSGYFLTDDEANLKKYWIGNNELIIPGNDWFLFWADDQTGQGQNHTNFKLSKDGEFVALVAPDGVTIVDSIRFGSQNEDYSYGRQTDGMQPWIEFSKPTPWYSNLSTRINDLMTEEGFVVYPNPVTAQEIFFNKPTTGEVFNISGVLIETFNNRIGLQLEGYSSGVYIIRNIDSGESVKLIVP
ncbi:MAG: CotH kinase family protein [Salibacteraceae bacterium]